MPGSNCAMPGQIGLILTRQGQKISSALCLIYFDPFLTRFRSVGVGSKWEDTLVMEPSRQAMVLILKECVDFTEESNITFSTDHNLKKSRSKIIESLQSLSHGERPVTKCEGNLQVPQSS